MTKFLKSLGWIVAVIMVADFFGFLVWGMSGQFPVDNFYLGSITRHILQAIFF